MKLPPHAISQFADLYLKHYGVRLTTKESESNATKFLSLFELLTKKGGGKVPKKRSNNTIK